MSNETGLARTKARMREVTQGLTVRQIAEKVGRPYTTIQGYLKEGTEPPATFISAFCAAFQVSERWILTGKGPKAGEDVLAMEETVEYLRSGRPDSKAPNEFRDRFGTLEGSDAYMAIPLVVDPVAAGAGAFVHEDIIEGFAIIYREWVPPGRVTAVQVTGESMVPTLPPGSLVAVHHDDKTVRDARLYCFHDRERGEAVVKRVRTTNLEGRFLVESDNPDKNRFPFAIWDTRTPEEAGVFEMIGRVIWSWTRFS